MKKTTGKEIYMRKIKLLFIPLILTMLLLSVSCHLLIPPTGGGEEGDSTLIYDKDTLLIS